MGGGCRDARRFGKIVSKPQSLLKRQGLQISHTERMKRVGEQAHPVRTLGYKVVDDLSMHVGEAVLATLKLEGESFVIETQKMQDGRLQVMHVNFVLGHAEAEFITGSVGVTRFHASACKHHRIDIGKMVSSEVLTLSSSSFAKRCAPKFTSPNYKRLIEKASSLEIFY